MTFFQIADCHLDSPLRGLPPAKAALRRVELRASLVAMVERAKQEGAQCVFMPGDLFDGPYVEEATLQAVVTAFAAASPVRFFIAPGNHDPLVTGSPYLYTDWPKNVHIFRSAAMEEVHVEEWNLSVYGCAATKDSDPDRGPLSGFRVANPNCINVGVFHGLVTGSSGSTYGPITKAELEASGFDYVALGHVHSNSIGRAGNTAYAYSGCHEGRGFDEAGPRGVLQGKVAKGDCAVKFLPTAMRRIEVLVVDVAGLSTPEDMARRCAEAATVASLGERDVVRFRLTGEISAETAVDTTTIAALAGAYFYSEVVDETMLSPDLAGLADSPTLTGAFVRRCQELLSMEADLDQQACIRAAMSYGLAALRGDKHWFER